MENNTICAISTPLGISGIGIVRLSGPITYSIIQQIFSAKNKKDIKHWKSHTVRYGHIIHNNNIIDEVLVTIMKAPGSYTRENMAEIGCHGGLCCMREILSICVSLGARLAAPGEFTKRAFINGRIDLVQAESILEIINSQTETSLEISVRKLEGGLSEKISGIRKEILNVLAPVEAKLDFPEEQAVTSTKLNVKQPLTKILRKVDTLLADSRSGKILVEGVKAAIVGKSNVGKSSLLNRLLREERALVTPIPGTTRDFLEGVINLRGIPVKIIDTAGIRKTKRTIEKMGVKKAVEWMKKADITILVLDGSRKLTQDDRELLGNIGAKAFFIAINKADLSQKIDIHELQKDFSQKQIVSISAKTGYGIKQLENKIYDIIQQGCGTIDGKAVYLNLRQENILRQTGKELRNVLKSCTEKRNLELIAEDLKYAVRSIDEIVGENISQEVLNNIFSQFCIGK